jgi:hypothetical protein
MGRLPILVTLAIAAELVIAQPAYAYLDPATSSFLLQIIFAAAAAGLLFFRTVWRRIRRILSRLGLVNMDDEDDEEGGSER